MKKELYITMNIRVIYIYRKTGKDNGNYSLGLRV